MKPVRTVEVRVVRGDLLALLPALALAALGLWALVPRAEDRPERVTAEKWVARIAEGEAAMVAIQEAMKDRSCWRTVQ